MNGEATTTLRFAEALLQDGWAKNVRLTIAGGVIAGIEAGAMFGTEPDCGIALPGLPNLHSHAFQRGMAGLSETRGPQSDSFWTWREVMYRFLDRLGPEDVQAIAAQAYAEMLEAGFTRVGEFHYLHHQPGGASYDDPAEMAVRIAAAAADTGIRLTLLPCFYAHGGFGAAEPAAGQRRFLHSVPAFARLMEGSRAAIASLPGARIGVAPHSLRAVAPAELTEIVALADGGPVHIHVAEQLREVEDCQAWCGQRPVAWLLDHAPVGPAWCLIHATHMHPTESWALARTGAVAGLCPVTEANLGDGIFDGPAWARAGGRLGVGTDSNVAIDAAGELRMLEYSQRLGLRARNVLAGAEGRSTGHALFGMAWAGGAQALGAAPDGLAVGAPADIVALDPGHPALATPLDGRLDGWIFASNRPAVDKVWVAGRQVVADGRHVARAPIADAFRRVLRRLLD